MDTRYDLLVYRDFTDTVNGRLLEPGEDGSLLGDEFASLRVAAVGDPLHESKHATIILAAGGPRVSALDEFLNSGRDGEEGV